MQPDNSIKMIKTKCLILQLLTGILVLVQLYLLKNVLMSETKAYGTQLLSENNNFMVDSNASAPIQSACEVQSQSYIEPEIWQTIDTILGDFPDVPVSGGIFLYKRQAALLNVIVKKLAEVKEKVTVCETGYGSGHSAALFLGISPKVHLTTFDKFDRPYQLKTLELILEKFGKEKITHVVGDSCKTVPSYAPMKHKCDLIHGSSLCGQDNIDLLYHLSYQGTVVTSTAMDSLTGNTVYFCPQCQWTRLRQESCIENIICYQEDIGLELKRDYVFNKQGMVDPHSFCFADSTGLCMKDKKDEESNFKKEGNFSLVAISSALTGLCNDGRIAVPAV